MHRHSSYCLAFALGAAVAPAAAAPSVSEPAEWNLSGKLGAGAGLTCHDPAPGPAEPVSQPMPAPVGTRHWAAKLRFDPAGSFQYWEIDAGLQQQPLGKWALYTGSWTQAGDRVNLYLDAKSAAALFNTYSGGSKCGSNNPCYDRQRYRFLGTVVSDPAGPRLALKQKVIFGVNSIRAPGLFQCNGQWRYTKNLKGR